MLVTIANGAFDAKAKSQVQSALAPENLITAAHFAVSLRTSLAKSEVDPGSVVAPRSANLASSLGSAKAALISKLSLSMIVVGVFLGAPTPNQALVSKPGTNSAMVGTSGSASNRVAVVTAKDRSLPDLMCPIDSGRTSNTT